MNTYDEDFSGGTLTANGQNWAGCVHHRLVSNCPLDMRRDAQAVAFANPSTSDIVGFVTQQAQRKTAECYITLQILRSFLRALEVVSRLEWSSVFLLNRVESVQRVGRAFRCSAQLIGNLLRSFSSVKSSAWGPSRIASIMSGARNA